MGRRVAGVRGMLAIACCLVALTPPAAAQAPISVEECSVQPPANPLACRGALHAVGTSVPFSVAIRGCMDVWVDRPTTCRVEAQDRAVAGSLAHDYGGGIEQQNTLNLLVTTQETLMVHEGTAYTLVSTSNVGGSYAASQSWGFVYGLVRMPVILGTAVGQGFGCVPGSVVTLYHQPTSGCGYSGSWLCPGLVIGWCANLAPSASELGLGQIGAWQANGVQTLHQAFQDAIRGIPASPPSLLQSSPGAPDGVIGHRSDLVISPAPAGCIGHASGSGTTGTQVVCIE